MSTTLRFTVDDLEALPDPLDDTRYELIDGELLVAHQPHWEHQFTSGTLFMALQIWSRQTGLGVANLAPELIFSPEDDVAPEVVWISRERRAQGVQDNGKLYVAPEIAIEILSPGSTNERRDRDLKRKLYAREGVEEYWLVDWRIRQIEIYRREGSIFELATTLTNADDITSPLLPGFTFPVRDLWETSLD
jgi:Uma2 family endonuclease